MKACKAIELLYRYLDHVEPINFTDLDNAIKLGTEALKRHRDIQQYSPTRFGLPLPGETEE